MCVGGVAAVAGIECPSTDGTVVYAAPRRAAALAADAAAERRERRTEWVVRNGRSAPHLGYDFLRQVPPCRRVPPGHAPPPRAAAAARPEARAEQASVRPVDPADHRHHLTAATTSSSCRRPTIHPPPPHG